MALRIVPQEEWAAFFDDLSREQESGQVTVIVRGQDIPQQEIIRQQPLLGISYESKGSAQGSIAIMAGSDATANVTHTITRPVSVSVESETVAGGVDTVLIDAEQGEPVTLVRFLSST